MYRIRLPDASRRKTEKTALRALQTESVDAVLLDVHLPDMSGIEVLEKLKQSGETRSIIMMTADPNWMT